jgi:co-chaperonin GroES (HSP10)
MTVTKLKAKLANKSGIYPSGNRVLVQQDPIKDELTSAKIVIVQQDPIKDELTSAKIVILEETREKYQSAQASGTLIAVGPDAWSHITERKYHVHGNGELELYEQATRGYSEPFARVGDRISFAKYSGQKYKGKDGERYLVINDEDVTCQLDDEVELTDLDTRKGVGIT